MTTWLTLEIHTVTGLTVHAEINDKQAKGMLADQWRYIFPRDDMSDQEKVIQMAMTQVAMAMEKGTGTFVAVDADGRTWLIPNTSIVAASVSGQDEKAKPMGFRQFEALASSPKTEG